MWAYRYKLISKCELSCQTFEIRRHPEIFEDSTVRYNRWTTLGPSLGLIPMYCQEASINLINLWMIYLQQDLQVLVQEASIHHRLTIYNQDQDASINLRPTIYNQEA